jgi:hypothetical protein
MDSLIDQPTVGHIKQVLLNLPQGINGLDETYDQAMKRIEGGAAPAMGNGSNVIEGQAPIGPVSEREKFQ